MAPIVHVFGALVTLLCAVLLLRHYAQTRSRLLLWAGLCFVCLAAANTLLLVDVVFVTDRDYYDARLWLASAGMALLMYGLIWESDRP